MTDDEFRALQQAVANLQQRVFAVAEENAAYSALFGALADTLGTAFLDRAAAIAEFAEANAQGGSPLGKRMTEAIRIIEQIRVIADGHPKPKGGI